MSFFSLEGWVGVRALFVQVSYILCLSIIYYHLSSLYTELNPYAYGGAVIYLFDFVARVAWQSYRAIAPDRAGEGFTEWRKRRMARRAGRKRPKPSSRVVFSVRMIFGAVGLAIIQQGASFLYRAYVNDVTADPIIVCAFGAGLVEGGVTFLVITVLFYLKERPDFSEADAGNAEEG
ncbi:hypothetical protein BV22DRAFT_299399 [Leucogyrophana mollusca]|uniref:Uncharacterized protein n=1 Tax=Leucogyrophana mollusca TaxID=85980 RepID=A0ACB8BQU1_9AGAM|nr:hypothetical protein BV22DRAFT_299399 [Leucogyrophana mollusca]